MPDTSYCLHCFHAPLGEHARCERCGEVSFPSQRNEYWTLRPWNRRVERLTKVAAVLAFPLGVAALFAVTGGLNRAAAWLVLLPALASVAVWKTGENWTRHNPYFRAGLVWSISLLALAIPAAFVHWSVGFAFVAASLAVDVLCALGERWKVRLRASGADRSAVNP